MKQNRLFDFRSSAGRFGKAAALSAVAVLLLSACENRPAHPLTEKTEAPVTTGLTVLTVTTTQTAQTSVTSLTGTSETETGTQNAVTETTKPAREAVSPESLPPGLNTFLSGVAHYPADYHADHPEHQEEFFLALLRGGLCDFAQYPGETYPGNDIRDPRWRWNEEIRWNTKAYNAEKINWILRNVFCWTDADINRLVALGEEGAYRPNFEQSFYLDGGVYYAWTGEDAVAGGYAVQADSITTDGMYYYITYRVQSGTPAENPETPAETTLPVQTDENGLAVSATTAQPLLGELTDVGMYQAIVLDRQLDGQHYWALLRKSDKPLF